jgi:cell division protein FtsI (penicillin-binding protein 3)
MRTDARKDHAEQRNRGGHGRRDERETERGERETGPGERETGRGERETGPGERETGRGEGEVAAPGAGQADGNRG